MHTLGGVWVAGQAWWIYKYWRYKKGLPEKTVPIKVYGICLASALVIGVLWEVFEFSLDLYVIFKQNDIVDTVTDIGADVAGGLIAAFLISRHEHKTKDE